MDKIKICVVGLGYVGLPLAVEFSKHFEVIGFDISERRINELREHKDSTREVSEEALKQCNVNFTFNQEEIKKCNFIVVAVQTPLTKEKKPDMSYVEGASEIVGRNLSRRAIVVYESTVYPGATEEVCIPILEKFSGMKCKKDFKVGYSPERINPGDKEHTLDKIIKVISGIDDETANTIEQVYSKIIKAGLFRAKNIKTAEASKVVENIQRDLNIALMNEFSLIFDRLGLDTKDVLDAASTKWNFHRYYPGLVGGHCIGVDSHYLTYKAVESGYYPKIILSGREVNDYIAKHLTEMIVKNLNFAGKVLNNCNVLVLGLTFKENVNDTRNSKVDDLIKSLKSYSINVFGCDPVLNKEQIDKYEVENIDFEEIKKNKNKFDCVVMAVKHDKFKLLSLDDLKEISKEKPILVDVKSFYNKEEAVKKGFAYKGL